MPMDSACSFHIFYGCRAYRLSDIQDPAHVSLTFAKPEHGANVGNLLASSSSTDTLRADIRMPVCACEHLRAIRSSNLNACGIRITLRTAEALKQSTSIELCLLGGEMRDCGACGRALMAPIGPGEKNRTNSFWCDPHAHQFVDCCFSRYAHVNCQTICTCGCTTTKSLLRIVNLISVEYLWFFFMYFLFIAIDVMDSFKFYIRWFLEWLLPKHNPTSKIFEHFLFVWRQTYSSFVVILLEAASLIFVGPSRNIVNIIRKNFGGSEFSQYFSHSIQWTFKLKNYNFYQQKKIRIPPSQRRRVKHINIKLNENQSFVHYKYCMFCVQQRNSGSGISLPMYTGNT